MPRTRKNLFTVSNSESPVSNALPHDQPAVRVHRRLGIVRLLEVRAVTRFHDPALGIGEVVLVGSLRHCLRWLWFVSANPFPSLTFRFTFCPFGFVLRPFRWGALCGPPLQHRPRDPQLFDPVPAQCDLAR